MLAQYGEYALQQLAQLLRISGDAVYLDRGRVKTGIPVGKLSRKGDLIKEILIGEAADVFYEFFYGVLFAVFQVTFGQADEKVGHQVSENRI